MLFTNDSLRTIQPRSYPYFLVEHDSPGFAVKVLKTGNLRFYYRKKTDGQRIDLLLGEELELARARYNSVVAREQEMKAKHNDALALIAGSTPHRLKSAPPLAVDTQIQNPLFYPDVNFPMLSKSFIAEHAQKNLRPSTARNYIYYLEKVQTELRDSNLMDGVIAVDDARQELKSYIHGMKHSTATQANRIREVLSSCFKWRIYEDLCYAYPIYGIRVFKECTSSAHLGPLTLNPKRHFSA